MKAKRLRFAVSVLALCCAGVIPAVVYGQADERGNAAQSEPNQNPQSQPDQQRPPDRTGVNTRDEQDQPGISSNASTALQQMARSLQSPRYSFTAQTIRVYHDRAGQPEHIFHTVNVIVRRPDRLAVHVAGDDGSRDLYYDGKSTALYQPEKNEYASIQSPDTIDGMMQEVFGRLNTDFPLADFLTRAPNKAFLAGVTRGQQEDTSMVDGTRLRHFSFLQPPGIELELWLDDNQLALPRRLIVTYHNLPDSPTFVALFSNWNFNVQPTDADFRFQPPAGATKVPFGSGYYAGQNQTGDK